mgnify:CR=1 FL=1
MKYLILLITLIGCSSDYKVANQGDIPHGDDTAIPVPDEETDTGTPDTEPPEEEEQEEEPPVGNPVAVCSVAPNPVHPPIETATWDGSASYDEDGYAIVAYDWSLMSKPVGSAIPAFHVSDALVPDFQPDLAGEYVAKLVVTNELGETDTCDVILESIPAEDLWVEMYWTQAPDDMDLHLINSANWVAALETSNDCYYLNCTGGWGGSVEWGIPGDEDNPSLDLDDIYGTGPENINIEQPQPTIFTVVVHDYTGSTPDTYDANEVTVNIYTNGALQWTDTKLISGDGSYTPFCHIDWATQLITGL